MGGIGKRMSIPLSENQKSLLTDFVTLPQLAQQGEERHLKVYMSYLKLCVWE